MTPKINYWLLGEAIHFYERFSYTYVEVPWLVSDYVVRATLPEGFDFWQIGTACHHGGDYGPRTDLLETRGDASALVGSAEQGFLTLDLAPGRYVGVTPCFRCEDEQNIFTRTAFMKVELFDNRPEATEEAIRASAMDFFMVHARANHLSVKTFEGSSDIDLGGIEIGSYGIREHHEFGRWAYGTGLALPRFDIANALSKVL